MEQVFNDAIEALRVSYRKMNPFCVPFATTNMGSAMLAMDLVCIRVLVLQVSFHALSAPLSYILYCEHSGMDGPKLFNFYCLCYQQLLYTECS